MNICRIEFPSHKMSGEGTSRTEQTPVSLQTSSSKVDKFKYHNTLSGLVRALVNQYTIVDLRNESYVSGKIITVDGNMNIEMTDVVLFDSRGMEHVFENFFVHSRNIRYVHVPKKFNSLELIERQLSAMSLRRSNKPAHTFKKVRAERRQKETLLSIYDQRKQTKESQ